MTQDDDCGQFQASGGDIDASKKGSVAVDLKMEGGQFVYVLTDLDGAGLVGSTREDGYYLRIEEKTDTVIDLYLAKDKDWQFDDPALTLKKSGNAKFYRVERDPGDPRHITVFAKSTGLPQQPKGEPGEIQPYNLHVLMPQPLGSPLKVRIDPDLKNPPPAGG